MAFDIETTSGATASNQALRAVKLLVIPLVEAEQVVDEHRSNAARFRHSHDNSSMNNANTFVKDRFVCEVSPLFAQRLDLPIPTSRLNITSDWQIHSYGIAARICRHAAINGDKRFSIITKNETVTRRSF
ncbi:hypothetical protein MRB53_038871 [Persea americana]|nr:hypothetical protein MRB53_038871 [Persea americana]